MAFPASPVNGQTYKNLIWNSTKSAWTQYTDWVNLSLSPFYQNEAGPGTWSQPQYKKVGDRVEIRGIHGRTGGVINGDIVASLPEHFRPPRQLTFILQAHSDLKTGHRVDIKQNGDIVITLSAGVSGSAVLGQGTPWINYDGVSFSISN